MSCSKLAEKGVSIKIGRQQWRPVDIGDNYKPTRRKRRVPSDGLSAAQTIPKKF